MFDNLDKPIYEFETRLNCECVETEIDTSVVNLQYTGTDSYENLDAYLSERRFMLHKLNLDDFSDPNCYKRAWLLDRTIIHVCLYPNTRKVSATVFLLRKNSLMLDIENVVLLYREHLVRNN